MANTPNSTNDRFSNSSPNSAQPHDPNRGVPNVPLPGQGQPGVPHTNPGSTYAPPGAPKTNPDAPYAQPGFPQTGQHTTPGAPYNPYPGTPPVNPPQTNYGGPGKPYTSANPRGPAVPSNPDLADQAKEVVGEVADQAKQVASHVAGLAKDEVSSRLSDQKRQAAKSLGSVAEALRMTGQQLRGRQEPTVEQYVNMAADQVDRVSDYLEHKDLGDMVDGVEQFARRQPALFVGGAVLLGILGARFLKSTAEPKRLKQVPRPAPLPAQPPVSTSPVVREPIATHSYVDPGPRPMTLYPPTGTTGGSGRR